MGHSPLWVFVATATAIGAARRTTAIGVCGGAASSNNNFVRSFSLGSGHRHRCAHHRWVPSIGFGDDPDGRGPLPGTRGTTAANQPRFRHGRWSRSFLAMGTAAGTRAGSTDRDEAVATNTTRTTPNARQQAWKTIARLEASVAAERQRGNRDDDNKRDDRDPVSFGLHPASPELVSRVASILRTLATRHGGKAEWRGILNKSTLLHEVEESILAIHFLRQELSKHRGGGSDRRDIVIVDTCCGKGVFALLSSYFFPTTAAAPRSDGAGAAAGNEPAVAVRKIIVLDKDPNLRWEHIRATNEDNENDNDSPRPVIECWPRCNLHDIDGVVDRLAREAGGDPGAPPSTNEAPKTPPALAVVGIHLCKTLSPACIGIANALGPEKCPHLVLAPCCLPRVVVRSGAYNNIEESTGGPKPSFLEVRRYETPSEKGLRADAKKRRDAAMVRGKGGGTRKRPTKMGEQISSLLLPEGGDRDNSNNSNSNIATGACWKCGEFGHLRADCPSDQTTGKPGLIKPPSLALDVSGILSSDRPFGSYCHLLATSIQRGAVAVEETSLSNNSSSHRNKQGKPKNPQQANNWNRERKSVYIVASGAVSGEVAGVRDDSP